MTEAARTLALADNLLREAKVRRDHSEDYDDDITSWIEQAEKIVRAVARSPLPGTREEVVRADWKLMPPEPNEVMMAAVDCAGDKADWPSGKFWKEGYRAMFAALPPAPMPGGVLPSELGSSERLGPHYDGARSITSSSTERREPREGVTAGETAPMPAPMPEREGSATHRSELDDASNACLELAAKHGFATGHGDTVADMIREFSAQISVPSQPEREGVWEALKPFGKLANLFDDYEIDHRQPEKDSVLVNVKLMDLRKARVALASHDDREGSLREIVYANAETTLIGFENELTEQNIKFICDQISRKVELAFSYDDKEG